MTSFVKVAMERISPWGTGLSMSSSSQWGGSSLSAMFEVEGRRGESGIMKEEGETR